MKRNNARFASKWCVLFCIAIPLLAALSPLALGWHTALGFEAEPFHDAPYLAQALVPLLGVASAGGWWMVAGDQRQLLALSPFAALATFNAFMWTKIVAFDPCYGSPDACADIFGSIGVAAGLFLCSVGLPLAAVAGGLVSVRLRGRPRHA